MATPYFALTQLSCYRYAKGEQPMFDADWWPDESRLVDLDRGVRTEPQNVIDGKGELETDVVYIESVQWVGTGLLDQEQHIAGEGTVWDLLLGVSETDRQPFVWYQSFPKAVLEWMRSLPIHRWVVGVFAVEMFMTPDNDNAYEPSVEQVMLVPAPYLSQWIGELTRANASPQERGAEMRIPCQDV